MVVGVRASWFVLNLWFVLGGLVLCYLFVVWVVV